jgi:spoIIIJ-associated protein
MTSASAERVRELLEHVVGAFGIQGQIELRESDEEIAAVIRGESLGLIIGRHGQTIDALQHLAYRIAMDEGAGKRVTVDAAGYRDRRAALLHHDADHAATDALRLGRSVALEPMTAAERRLVHEYLRERGDVETHSEGEEPERRLVVSPLDA